MFPSMDNYAPNVHLARRIGQSVTPPGKMLADIYRAAAQWVDNLNPQGTMPGWYLIPDSGTCIYLACDRGNGPLREAAQAFHCKRYPLTEKGWDPFYFGTPPRDGEDTNERRVACKQSFLDCANAAEKMPSGFFARCKWDAAMRLYAAQYCKFPR